MKKFMLVFTLVLSATLYAQQPLTITEPSDFKWTYVGYKGFSAGAAKDISLAINESGQPYVAFVDGANGWDATVMKFNGTSWE